MSNMNRLREDGFVWYMVLEGAVHTVWPCAVRKNVLAAGTYDRAVLSHLCDQEANKRKTGRGQGQPTPNYSQWWAFSKYAPPPKFSKTFKNHGIVLWPRLTKFAGDISCLNHNSTSLSGFCMFASWDHLLSELLSASWSQFLYLGESNPANQISIIRGII